jgi:hypothetical protein
MRELGYWDIWSFGFSLTFARSRATLGLSLVAQCRKVSFAESFTTSSRYVTLISQGRGGCAVSLYTLLIQRDPDRSGDDRIDEICRSP